MNTLLELIPLLIGLTILLALSAFFSGSETALFSLSRTQVKRMSRGHRGERMATRLLKEPQRLLSTLLVGNLVVNVLIATLVAGLARRLVGDGAVPVAIGVSTCLLLLFGEVTPKSIAVSHAAFISRYVSIPLQIVSEVVLPARVLLNWITHLFLTILGGSRSGEWGKVTREEVGTMLELGEAAGAATITERELAEHILGLVHVDAHDLMVPRIETKGVSDALTVGEAFEKACQWRHAHLPVYNVNLDRIWGVLPVAELPRWRGSDMMDRPLADFRPQGDAVLEDRQLPVKPVELLPENAAVEQVLRHMRKTGTPFVVLVGEYGGTAGILTRHDVLAEIIGHFSAMERRHKGSVQQDANSWLVGGRTHLREVNRVLSKPLVQSGTDTVGGYVMERLGRLPRPDDQVEDDTYLFQVIRMAGRRVGTVRITQRLTPEGGETPCQ